MLPRVVVTIVVFLAIAPGMCRADAVANPVVIPQVGVLQHSGKNSVTLQSVAAAVTLGETEAETTLDLTIRCNATSTRCDLAVPVSKTGSVRRVEILPDKSKSKAAGTVLKSELRANSAARSFLRDLSEESRTTMALEFFGSPFAIVRDVVLPANSAITVRVQYAQPVRSVGNRRDYVLLRSERLSYNVPWSITATIVSKEPVAGVYSPSHPLTIRHESMYRAIATVVRDAPFEPGPFRLSWLTGRAAVTGTVFGYPPHNDEDGYFLWLLQTAKPDGKTPLVPQEVTLVIDRSASMRGNRLKQVQAAANTVINGLKPRDSFNIITYNNDVNSFAAAPVGNTGKNTVLAQTFLNNIEPSRGADYYAALRTCLDQPAPKGKLPIVLFFTDGLPTSGLKREDQIRTLARKQNVAGRRIYAFSLGTDVNSALLQQIANDTGGKANFVLPGDDITKTVKSELQRLQHPVLTGTTFAKAIPGGKKTANGVHSLLPSTLSDLFAGDQVAILGRYRGTEPVTLLVAGKQADRKTTFAFSFDPKTADRENTFIPRLWVSRRIAELVEKIRQTGATAKSPYATPGKFVDPTVSRASQEILKLTAEYGIVTEYTAFLCNGSNTPFQRGDVVQQVIGNFDTRAVRSRAGKGAVNQEFNNGTLITQSRLNGRNRYWDKDMSCVSVGNVQQVGTSAFFLRGGRWVDGRLISGKTIPQPKRTIRFGTAAYWDLVKNLTAAGQTGILAMNGDILLQHHGRPVLVTGPASASQRRTAR